MAFIVILRQFCFHNEALDERLERWGEFQVYSLAGA